MGRVRHRISHSIHLSPLSTSWPVPSIMLESHPGMGRAKGRSRPARCSVPLPGDPSFAPEEHPVQTWGQVERGGEETLETHGRATRHASPGLILALSSHQTDPPSLILFGHLCRIQVPPSLTRAPPGSPLPDLVPSGPYLYSGHLHPHNLLFRPFSALAIPRIATLARAQRPLPVDGSALFSSPSARSYSTSFTTPVVLLVFHFLSPHFTTTDYVVLFRPIHPSSFSSYSRTPSTTSPKTTRAFNMCNVTRNYYIYSSCRDPGVHYFQTEMDGDKTQACSQGPHERYIVQPGSCPLCNG